MVQTYSTFVFFQKRAREFIRFVNRKTDSPHPLSLPVGADLTVHISRLIDLLFSYRVLVSSGRLIEAVENLDDWLMKVEPELSDLKQIDGDVYTVNNLIDQHRNC